MGLQRSSGAGRRARACARHWPVRARPPGDRRTPQPPRRGRAGRGAVDGGAGVRRAGLAAGQEASSESEEGRPLRLHAAGDARRLTAALYPDAPAGDASLWDLAEQERPARALPPFPPFRTNWTRLVPPPVPTGPARALPVPCPRPARQHAVGQSPLHDEAEAPALLPPRTKWTRRVPHPVLIGHAASLTPY
jgi:hypothetical protein